MNFTLHLPNGYARQPLPGLDEWVSDLRANPDKQTKGCLGTPYGPNCCLGRISLLQERLTERGEDGESGKETCLSSGNPYRMTLSSGGFFPNHVKVEIPGANDPNAESLAECNDAGLTFAQIATIIESVWYNSGPLLK